jgi:hypothetical protein
MDRQDRTAAKGTWGTVEWALNARLRMPAREFYLALPQADQDKVAALFQRLAETGRIQNVDKFKSIVDAAGRLWEFKSFQVRFLGDFRPGKRFVLAYGVRKKQDKLDKVDIQVAVRILAENDAVEAADSKGGKR